jgi:hypothetical protein
MSNKVEWPEIRTVLDNLHKEGLLSEEELEQIEQINPVNWKQQISEWKYIHIFDPYEGGTVIISRFEKILLSLTFEEDIVSYFLISVRTKQGYEFCGFEQDPSTGSWLYATENNSEIFQYLLIDQDGTDQNEISIKEGLSRLMALCKAIGYL